MAILVHFGGGLLLVLVIALFIIKFQMVFLCVFLHSFFPVFQLGSECFNYGFFSFCGKLFCFSIVGDCLAGSNLVDSYA